MVLLKMGRICNTPHHVIFAVGVHMSIKGSVHSPTARVLESSNTPLHHV